MIESATNLENNQHISADVCVIGAGAAGISMSLRLHDSGIKVLLLESGGLAPSLATQQLYKGRNIGHEYFPLEGCRLRYFGGTTGHWGGTCRPFDEIDFEKKEWIPYSGWPISRKDLDSYYREAHKICDLGPYDYDPDNWQEAGEPPLPFKDPRLINAVFQKSSAQFGEIYREELRKSEDIRVLLDANVTNIDVASNHNHVTSVQVATLTQKKFKITAKYFVLCAGGLENPRILLNSTDVMQYGIGNEHDLVGRFFMEHPIMETGVMMGDDFKHDFYHEIRKTMIVDGMEKQRQLIGFITPTEATLRNQKMLNCGIRLQRTSWDHASKGLLSAQQLLHGDGGSSEDFGTSLFNIVTDLDGIVSNYARKVFTKPAKVMKLIYWSEPQPNPESNVQLDHEKDQLGMNKIKLRWRLLDEDIDNFEKMHQLLAQILGISAIGRIRVDHDRSSWLVNTSGSFHHMGTTRMHKDPKQGVVDSECRVHGLDNLYIGGSSVFPTAGQANPTLTIVALAVRIADHIKNRLTVA